MKRVSPLPSLLTCFNFTCGFVAIILCMQSARVHALGQEGRAEELLFYACAAIFIAMVFDMLDGRVARMTGAVSRFGGELDSLADDCSFGVAPAVIVTTLWIQTQPEGKQWYGQVMLCGAVYAACAILRLARYNVETGTSDKNYFVGLPSPGAAGAVVSTVLFCKRGEYLDWLWGWMETSVSHAPVSSVIEARVIAIYMLVIGVLMVTRLHFVHVANRWLGGRKRLTTLVAFIFGLMLLFERPVEVLFIAFNGYVAVSLVSNLLRYHNRPKAKLVADDPSAEMPS